MDSKRNEMFARYSPRASSYVPSATKQEIEKNSIFRKSDESVCSWMPVRAISLGNRSIYASDRFVQAQNHSPTTDTVFSGGLTLAQKKQCMINVFVKGQNFQQQLAKQQLDQTQPNLHRIQAPGAFLGYRF